MATTIKLKNGSGAPLAGDLVQGEPALDLTNKRLYTENASGTVIEVGTNPTSLTTGTFTSTGIDDNATSTAITIDSDGDVGIGVSPAFTAGGSRKLLQIANSTNGAQIAMSNSSSESENPRIFSDSTNLGFATAATGSGAFQFYTAGTERMRITAAGSIGLNTTNPQASFVVSNTSNERNLEMGYSGGTSANYIQTYDRDASAFTDLEIYSATTAFHTGSSAAERMRIDSNGNVGIGVSSVTNPSDRTALQIGGGSSGGGVYLGSNTTDTENGRVVTDSSGGVYIATATTGGAPIGLYTANAERMRIDSSGNVGIGQSNPTSKLVVSNDGYEGFEIDPVGVDGQVRLFSYDRNAGGTGTYISNIWYGDGWDFYDGNAATYRVRIDSSGKIQIGNNIPMWSGSYGGALFLKGNNSTSDRYAQLNVVDSTGATVHLGLIVDNSGFVGANTTSPSTQFEAAGNTSSVANNITTYNASTTSTAEVSVDWALNRTGSEAKIRAARISAGKDQTWTTTGSTVDGYLRFMTVQNESLGEHMRITSSGDVLVGTTSPTVSGAAGFGVLPAGNAAASPFVFSSSDASVDSHVTWAAYSRGVSAYRFYVGYGGTVFATSTSITALSDESLKENIRDLDKGLETINALQPRRFDWKNGDGNDIMGFVAQEVEGIMPELVHEYTYSKEETKLGLKMGDMIPSMVKAIQELSAQVSELKAEVAALKGA